MSNKDKSLISKLTLENDEIIEIRMPRIGGIIGIFYGTGKPLIEFIIPAATGKPWEWFCDLPILDGIKIIKEVQPIIKEVNEMFENIAAKITTKH